MVQNKYHDGVAQIIITANVFSMNIIGFRLQEDVFRNQSKLIIQSPMRNSSNTYCNGDITSDIISDITSDVTIDVCHH